MKEATALALQAPLVDGEMARTTMRPGSFLVLVRPRLPSSRAAQCHMRPYSPRPFPGALAAATFANICDHAPRGPQSTRARSAGWPIVRRKRRTVPPAPPCRDGLSEHLSRAPHVIGPLLIHVGAAGGTAALGRPVRLRGLKRSFSPRVEIMKMRQLPAAPPLAKAPSGPHAFAGSANGFRGILGRFKVLISVALALLRPVAFCQALNAVASAGALC